MELILNEMVLIHYLVFFQFNHSTSLPPGYYQCLSK